ncbi:MAG: hypothetical protein ABIS50_06645 [Luteolibacter sp.]|uniref:hypothetical protein n=1 Tax=Luteolibacter sp. TaxID=1962973 RepID=UPI003265C532
MKIVVAAALAILAQQPAMGAETPLQLHKKSLTKEIDSNAEIIAFYKDLLNRNPTVKHQFDQLIRQSPEYGDPHFGPDDPQLVEWFPRTESGRIEDGHSTEANFLVIQNLSFTRPNQHDSNLAVVSEFHVIHTNKSHAVSGLNGPSASDSDEVTITFLGFRDFKLSPIKPIQAEPKTAPDHPSAPLK